MSDSPNRQTPPHAVPETELDRPRAGATEASVRHFRLDLLEGDATKKTFEHAAERCSVGSHQSNDVVLDEPTVSRFHCEIRFEKGGPRVVDLESRNGTVLDGVLVRDAHLRAGSILQLGRAALRFQPADQRSPLPLSKRTELGGLVGESIAMRACFAVLERAAESEATLLLEGETGTGKSRAARAVHALSARAKGPFLTLDCGAIPANLLESELFGHRKGAFTGASDDRAGIFQDAAGGTVFLDEIGELPLELQSKLLKALEDREVRRVGTSVYRPIDVRVIAATNRDLRAEVNGGRFRPDLFYRLAVVRLTIPSLRQRPEDIAVIAKRLLDALGASEDVSAALRTPEFIARLEAAAWPGNVRELRNHLERCLVFRDALPPVDEGARATEGAAAPSGPRPGETLSASWQRLHADRGRIDGEEQAIIRRALTESGGVIAQAARALGVARTTLASRLDALGMRGRLKDES